MGRGDPAPTEQLSPSSSPRSQSCSGTHVGETPVSRPAPVRDAKQSFADVRSQAELGNEGNNNCRGGVSPPCTFKSDAIP